MLVPDLLSGLAPCLSPGSGLRDLLTTRPTRSKPYLLCDYHTITTFALLIHCIHDIFLSQGQYFHVKCSRTVIAFPQKGLLFSSCKYWSNHFHQNAVCMVWFLTNCFLVLHKWSIHTWSHQPILPVSHIGNLPYEYSYFYIVTYDYVTLLLWNEGLCWSR